MTNKKKETKLPGLAKATPSFQWKEKVEYKKENRAWLKKSVDIALRVLDVLEARNMTQIELANELNVSRQQVSKILKGQENLTLETISKLEDALGIPLMTVPEDDVSKAFNKDVVFNRPSGHLKVYFGFIIHGF